MSLSDPPRSSTGTGHTHEQLKLAVSGMADLKDDVRSLEKTTRRVDARLHLEHELHVPGQLGAER